MITIGNNVGDAIIQALEANGVEFDHHATAVEKPTKREFERKFERKKENRKGRTPRNNEEKAAKFIVGVELPPAEEGALTTNAMSGLSGRVVVGPKMGMDLSYEQFVARLEIRRLVFHRFTMDRKTGKLRKGALIGLTPGYFTCRCNPDRIIKQTEPAAQKREVLCKCGARMQFVRTPADVPAGSAAIKKMYESYLKGADGMANPYPRSWGIYDSREVPTEVLEETDGLARELQNRAEKQGCAVRSVDVVLKSGAQPMTMVIETLPGLRIGALTRAEMTGERFSGDRIKKKIVPAAGRKKPSRRTRKCAVKQL